MAGSSRVERKAPSFAIQMKLFYWRGVVMPWMAPCSMVLENAAMGKVFVFGLVYTVHYNEDIGFGGNFRIYYGRFFAGLIGWGMFFCFVEMQRVDDDGLSFLIVEIENFDMCMNVVISKIIWMRVNIMIIKILLHNKWTFNI